MIASSTEDITPVFHKITNETENHNKFQYKDGLNVLIESFNSNPIDTCCAGGLYFTDVKNILKFVHYGCYLREIILPLSDPDFQIIKDPEGDKWRANKIIFGKKYKLLELETIIMLEKNGADLHIASESLLKYAAKHGQLEIIKYLVERKANIHSENEYLLRWASLCGHLDTVKYLVEQGADVHADHDRALEWASQNGHFEIVKYLVEKKADVHTENESALIKASKYGHHEIVKYLVENGADVQFDNCRAATIALRHENTKIMYFLQNYQAGNKIVDQ
jgi:hypothetical protein